MAEATSGRLSQKRRNNSVIAKSFGAVAIPLSLMPVDMTEKAARRFVGLQRRLRSSQ